MKNFNRSTFFAVITTSIVACSSPSALPTVATLSGYWQVKSIQDKPVITSSQVKLFFNQENRLSGQASCNNITSNYTQQNNALTIGPIASTRKMCLPVLMQQEKIFLQALSKITRFELNDGELSMFNQQDVLQLKATRAETAK